MPASLHIGCCGWSYLIEKNFSKQIAHKASSKLQSYAQLFDTVEINSTFYRLPTMTTAQKWFKEAREVNKKFTFTVKAYQGITHINRFGEKSKPIFKQMQEVCHPLRATIVLFQSPASFAPSALNIKKMKLFFSTVDSEELTFVWEPRGKWYEEPQTIIDVCEEFNLIHCVDPFRNEPLVFGRENITYFRLHGFGKPSMYRYNFSDKELEQLNDLTTTCSKKLRHIYIFFNNVFCYENAYTFRDLIVKA
ncbi:MAG: DUF72 domain-containing protein [Ignavibacteriae bacterium]|nr:DUF72 domain-containing protein [Ignavibacteriota bacterium]